MKYKVGDKVRVRGNLKFRFYGEVAFVPNMEEYKCKTGTITRARGNIYKIAGSGFRWSDKMLRPAEFKIWCGTEEEKKAVLKELEKEGYMWANSEELEEVQSDVFNSCEKVAFYVVNNCIEWNDYKTDFDEDCRTEITPSEFTGIDFSEKITIIKTPDGAKAIYKDKTVEEEGDFSEASRKALAIVLCPIDVGDKARWGEKIVEIEEIIEKISEDMEVLVSDDKCKRWVGFDELEPYEERKYSARIFCTQGSGNFEKGKIYEVKDGIIKNRKVKDLVDINKTFAAQFMEVVEDD